MAIHPTPHLPAVVDLNYVLGLLTAFIEHPEHDSLIVDPKTLDGGENDCVSLIFDTPFICTTEAFMMQQNIGFQMRQCISMLDEALNEFFFKDDILQLDAVAALAEEGFAAFSPDMVNGIWRTAAIHLPQGIYVFGSPNMKGSV